jgi:tetratricopeptide (TPR) repeat protein
VQKLTVDWPSGRSQVFTDVAVNDRLRLVEEGELEKAPFAPQASRPSSTPAAGASDKRPAHNTTWLYEPFAAPDFSLQDTGGQTRSLAAMRGKPAVLLFWSTAAARSRTALDALARGADALTRAGIGALAIALDPPPDAAGLRAAAAPALPIAPATREVALSYAILNRHVYMNRQDLQLPAIFLLDASGGIVKAYRDTVDPSEIVRDAKAIDASAAQRLTRAVPFAGTFYAPLPLRNYLPYGRELLDQGLDASAIDAFERAAQASPNASTLYRLGTLLAKSGDSGRARTAFERALAIDPALAEAHNDLGALIAQGGDLDAAIARFRAALASTPEYPDALNNLGYALLLTGRDQEARALYEKALALQPDFPEALNNLGLLFGRAGELDRAERLFRDALARRPDYGEAVNNVALVLVARGQIDEAIRLLEGFLQKTPQYEDAYVSLAKIFFSKDRVREGLAVLERLLQRNPKHAVGLELLRQWKPR